MEWVLYLVMLRVLIIFYAKFVTAAGDMIPENKRHQHMMLLFIAHKGRTQRHPKNMIMRGECMQGDAVNFL